MLNKKRYKLKRDDSKFDLFKQIIGFCLTEKNVVSKRDINHAIKVCENMNKKTIKIGER